MKLEVWFEFASTYSYLTVSRVEHLLTGTQIELVWRPFLLGPLLRDKGLSTSPFNLDPAKGTYMWRDVARRSEKYGLPFVRPSIFPMNGLVAARVMTAALDEDWCGDFARLVFAAQFGRGADISDEALLKDALTSCGVSPEPWFEKAQTNEIKSRLRGTTDRARQLGIFGAPSFIAQDELFWGDDRLDDAIDFALSRTR